MNNDFNLMLFFKNPNSMTSFERLLKVCSTRGIICTLTEHVEQLQPRGDCWCFQSLFGQRSYRTLFTCLQKEVFLLYLPARPKRKTELFVIKERVFRFVGPLVLQQVHSKSCLKAS